MQKEQIKAEILSALSAEIDTWLETQSNITDGYEYESRYMLFSRKVNRIVLQKSMGTLPGSRNKKNFIPVWEK